MRATFILVLVLFGCGGPPTTARPAKAPLPRGEAVYVARFNPAPCLHDSPELQLELKVGEGWERVAIVSGDEEQDLAKDVLERFETAPRTTHRMLGYLGRSTVRYSDDHFARQFTIEMIDPPADPSEDEEP